MWHGQVIAVLGSLFQNSEAEHSLLHLHRSKKTCQLIFGSVSVKCKPISIKIGRHAQEETLNEIT